MDQRKVDNQLIYELVGFYRLMVSGYYHYQLQSYKYNGEIKTVDKLYYYNREKPNKKLVLFLNGGTRLNPGHNIEKIISELMSKKVDYDIATYINMTTHNLLCTKDICKTIRRLDYQEIDVVGLSVGTLIGSHVLHKLIRKGTPIRLKLICIDPIMNMYDSAIRTFTNNYIYRPDLLQHFPEAFFNARQLFHCGYSELFQMTNMDNYVAFLGRHYGLSTGKYKRLVRFQFDLPNCNVHLIHTLNDPVVIFEENRYQYKDVGRNKTCKVHNHYIADEISHCTMIQSNPELQMEFLTKCIGQ